MSNQLKTGQKNPIAIVMITLNEAHNLEGALMNVSDWAEEVFIVDSFSKDESVDIALRYGAKVVQRRFRNFGDQWNFALEQLPIRSKWTMKLDPDERLTDDLKKEISTAILDEKYFGFSMIRRLWFMNCPLPVRQRLTRVWQTGKCRFSDVEVNEHPMVEGAVGELWGEIEHHDSPDLDHWYEKQNRYTTSEAIMRFTNASLADTPKLLGSTLQRRMWLKKHFARIPFRYFLFFLYSYLVQSAWRAGRVGWIWARLRTDVMRMIDLKHYEMTMLNRIPSKRQYGPGLPDSRVEQAD